MSHESTAPAVPTSRAVRHHLVLVVLLVVLGAAGGWWYAGSATAAWSSSASVLINPASGNPFVPTPSAVRQDEPTSLETEAQVARSAEVLAAVDEKEPDLDLREIERGLQVTVPPNTQVLQITFTSSSPRAAERVAGEVARAYLANRERRSDAVTAGRVEQVEDQTIGVLADLKTATAAAQRGSAAERLFQSQLATALRNQLVNLRAQRSALETSEAPADSVIAPATAAQRPADLVATVAPVGGALAGLALACLLAVLLERTRGRVRSAAEVEELGVPVVARVTPAVPTAVLRRGRGDQPDQLEQMVRRLRGTLLGLDPRPDSVAVAPAGPGEPVAAVAEALAESFARGGHRVVLVRTCAEADSDDLVVEEGLAQALTYERLSVQGLLRPTVEPMLGVLPAGRQTSASQELFTVERLRMVVAELVGAGNLVVVESPALDSAEGQVVTAAADLTLVVATIGRTRRSVVAGVVRSAPPAPTPVGAVVLAPGSAARRDQLSTAEAGPRHADTSAVHTTSSAGR
ncbi:hypothetical protein G6553_14805 [Nocardioides sp. IC4_145]|uniref:hypothetical protein n=1 Tax=Nocardioides sp. IC4_145 TaxID=2714037 RepID=UPI001409FCA6|nr:hypothetical protein [Nocardioides sp. IC4_145]NHC24438.1 hypothetical protein [Nocardioides sp. IC4_145]